MSDTLKIGTKEFTSRFLLGTGKFSLEKTAEAVNAADARSLPWRSGGQRRQVPAIF